MYKVKEVANLVGVSVRTLHHYDEIELLQPESITPAGYRLYTNQNLKRLQQILFFKEMGISLQQIKDILDRPDFDQLEALRMHEEMLKKKKSRIDTMIQTVQQSIHALEHGNEMEETEMFKGFDMKEIEEHQKRYAEEVRQTYPNDLVKQSEQKTSQYTAQDWKRIKEETNDIYQAIASHMSQGPDDPEVQRNVARWHQFITNNFYDCSIDIFRGLADLYVADERFTKNIDKHKEGLAVFLSEAMIIYCDEQQK